LIGKLACELVFNLDDFGKGEISVKMDGVAVQWDGGVVSL